MDQPEQTQALLTHDDLIGADAIAKIKELAENIKTCFFCTMIGSPDSCGSRPMTVLDIDESGDIWFLCSNESHLFDELKRNAFSKLYFQGSSFSDFLMLNGTASCLRNHERLKELWSPTFKTWFTGGIDDPRISLIKFSPVTGYYWDNKHGDTIAAIKMLVGAAIGKTIDDSISGSLDVLHVPIL